VYAELPNNQIENPSGTYIGHLGYVFNLESPNGLESWYVSDLHLWKYSRKQISEIANSRNALVCSCDQV